jgi:hypothetical protein
MELPARPDHTVSTDRGDDGRTVDAVRDDPTPIDARAVVKEGGLQLEERSHGDRRPEGNLESYVSVEEVDLVLPKGRV